MTSELKTPTVAYQRWNDALIRALFKGDDQTDGPVRSLAISDEFLNDAIGGVFPDPADARKSLLAAFRHAHTSVAFHTALRDNGSWTPQSYGQPPFVVHLVVTCLLASNDDALEDLDADEETFRKRLDIACGRSGSQTAGLSEAWESLARWLRIRVADGDHLRTLELPQRRSGWRHIGYSLDLAFPSKRDRADICDALRARGILPLSTPPVHRVIEALERSTHHFSKQLKRLLIEFVGLVKTDEARWSHPLWRAVLDVISDLSSDEEASQSRVRLLAAFSEGRDLQPYVVVDNEAEGARLGFACAPIELEGIGNVFYLVDDLGGVTEPVETLLRNGRVSSFTPFVIDGAIPFVFLDGLTTGTLEAVRGERTVEAEHFLVPDNRKSSLQERFRSRRPQGRLRVEPSVLSGYLQVLDAAFTASGLTSLSELAPPEQRLLRPHLRPIGGIRLGDAWFGAARFLPLLSAPHGARVFISRSNDNERRELFQNDEGQFALPDQDLDGDTRVYAEGDDGDVQLSLPLTFRRSAPAWSLLPWTEPLQRHLVEGRTVDEETLARAIERQNANELVDVKSDENSYVYLGPAVGQLSTNPDCGFDWCYVLAHQQLSFVGDPDNPTPPRHERVDNGPACRLWKKAFDRDEPIGPPAIFHAYRSLSKKPPKPALPLFEAESESRPYRLEAEGVRPTEGVLQLADDLATIFAKRIEIDASTMFALLESYLGMSDFPISKRQAITRGWIEAGTIEPCWSGTWSGLGFVARPPHLVLFRSGPSFHGALVGLSSRMVIDRVREEAERDGVQFTDRLTTSGYSPGIPLLTSNHVENIVEVSKRLPLGSPSPLPAVSDVVASVSSLLRFDRDPPESGGTRSALSFADGVFRSEGSSSEAVRLIRLSTPRAPTRYLVESDGKCRWWSRARNWAILAALELRKERVFAQRGRLIQRANIVPVYLPVAAARWVAAVSPVAPGPIQGSSAGQASYRYTLPEAPIAASVLRSISALYG